ncbi:hypothetical protein QYE76_048582 [Lolium multiflorum]|uniref:DUF4371 domain-containing protein n=1 Tax=Lolium multiflorum TaxID=4521 RepID=A0AAD8SNE1_LOLMU|nr:hypothetical protein QYE76_048582 [Lolium multiflorum]
MIDMLKDGNEQIRDSFDRGGRNCQMTSGEIQKDLARCCAEEVTEVIMGDLGDKQFSVLIDESRDISVKEQMAVMLRLEIVFCFIYSFSIFSANTLNIIVIFYFL